MFLDLICGALFLLQLLLVATVVVSWFPVAPGSPLERLAGGLRAVTEPALEPVRRLAPPVRLGTVSVDVAPLLWLILLLVLRAYICS